MRLMKAHWLFLQSKSCIAYPNETLLHHIITTRFQYTWQTYFQVDQRSQVDTFIKSEKGSNLSNQIKYMLRLDLTWWVNNAMLTSLILTPGSRALNSHFRRRPNWDIIQCFSRIEIHTMVSTFKKKWMLYTADSITDETYYRTLIDVQSSSLVQHLSRSLTVF